MYDHKGLQVLDTGILASATTRFFSPTSTSPFFFGSALVEIAVECVTKHREKSRIQIPQEVIYASNIDANRTPDFILLKFTFSDTRLAWKMSPADTCQSTSTIRSPQFHQTCKFSVLSLRLYTICLQKRHPFRPSHFSSSSYIELY